MNGDLNPPTCIKELRITKAVRTDDATEEWEYHVACRCGADDGRVLGHWLVHPDRPPQKVFVGPLSLECQSCGAVTPVLDTTVHGYDASLHGDYNMKGSGVQVPFDNRFGQVIAAFTYQIDDLVETAEESGVPAENLFDGCCVWLFPSGAAERVLVAGFECA
jgi:hypothetical protein